MIYSQVALILIGSFWAPWWWIVVVGLIYGWRFRGIYPVQQLVISSFISAFMVWSLFSFYYDLQSMGRVGEWISHLFKLPFPSLSYVITGGLAGGVTALSCFVGSKVQKKK